MTRTKLGAKLWAQRQKIIASGVPYVDKKGQEMKNCKSCKYWVDPKHSYDMLIYPTDEDTYEEKKMPFRVRECRSPHLLFLERPVTPHQATLEDGSGYKARMVTGPDFGCVNWEGK